jgi:hypothetical protein
LGAVRSSGEMISLWERFAYSHNSVPVIRVFCFVLGYAFYVLGPCFLACELARRWGVIRSLQFAFLYYLCRHRRTEYRALAVASAVVEPKVRSFLLYVID